MQLPELQEIADSLGQAVILGKTNSILGFNVSSMSITDPIPSPTDSGWAKVRKCNEKDAFCYLTHCFFFILTVLLF